LHLNVSISAIIADVVIVVIVVVVVGGVARCSHLTTVVALSEVVVSEVFFK